MKEKEAGAKTQIPQPVKIEVLNRGPLLVFGRPPLRLQFIMTDDQGACRNFRAGRAFDTSAEPTALCRCGASSHKPYCDGSHQHAEWESTLTADLKPLLEEARFFRGEGVVLSDNERYCVSARFCDARGGAWNLVKQSSDPAARDIVVEEANHCPNSRLSAWDPATGEPLEKELPAALGLIEDPAMGVSGGVLVTGGIPVENEEGGRYELRNRVVLCRCGASSNKPYCDGAHIGERFRDGIQGTPDGEEW